ncbi:MAG: sigma-70 family RNA polymerase sigma factor [Candidatus Hydrogenedentes bacterium]|nr:sigma-70 family RNA polymerase sigma factor [Candidatus Hydrogenedentota bacterium]
MDNQELERLVEAAKRGDAQAFARLTQAHYRLVYSLAYSTVGDWSAAQDIAQDAFLVAWTHLGNLRGAGAFPMWIRKIARNLALNWIRSADYRRRLAERHEQLVAPLQEPPQDPAQLLGREERRAALWKALQHLSPPVREAMVLFYLEGRSTPEAAAKLGISENAFKLRLHTGRARLRKFLEDQVEESLYADLAPQDTKSAAGRVLAGLAIGPVMPDLAQSVSGAGISMWLHHVAHNGVTETIIPILQGGAIVNAKKIAIGAAVAALCAGGAYWGIYRAATVPQSGENWRRVSKSETPYDVTDLSAPASAADTTSTAAQLAKSESQYDTATDEASNVELASAPDEQLQPTGDMTASAALLMSMEKGRIKDPKDYATVSGTVVDTHGSPIEDATVQVSAIGGAETPQGISNNLLAALQNPAHKQTAQTDPAGRFTVQGIAYEGRATVMASADGYKMMSGGRVPVPIKAGDKIDNVRITLEPGKGLYGRLLSPDGKPVTDGVVNLVAIRTRGDSSNGMLGSTNTDAKGQFHFAFSREGTASLVTSSLKYGGASFDDVPVGGEDVIELQMPKGAQLTGTITWAAGGAASDVLVFLVGKANDGRGLRRNPASVYAAKTDSGGNYTIDAIDANQSYSASVAMLDETALSQPQPVPDFSPGGTQTWDYAIQELIYVRGRVVGETTGRPLHHVKVAALKDGKYVQDSDTPTGADGSYELKLSSGPGNYRIYPRLWRIEPEQTGYEWGKDIQLSAAQEATLDLTFVDTATMSIKVVDAAGNPLSDMGLGIREDDHTWGPVARTAADGTYTWNGFMPGIETNFVVFGQGGPGRLGSTRPTVLEPGQVVPEETVVVYGSAGIEGIAVGPNGQPLPNGVIILHVYYALTHEIERRVNTDDTGHFLIESQLPATAVFLSMEGYTETDGSVDRYSYESDEIELIDKQIVDLGKIAFTHSESNVNVED